MSVFIHEATILPKYETHVTLWYILAMDFENFAKESARAIDGEITKVLTSFRQEVSQTDKTLLLLIDQFISACQGGKKIRGVMVLLGYEIARRKGQGERGEVYKAAAAVEIFQTAILAHDDIIDQSPTRRGKPSLYKSTGKDEALILADMGFFLANTLISDPKALNFFNKVMVKTCLGQLLDIQELKGIDRIKMYELKTAWYTFIGPLSLGAILAGADEEKMLGQLGLFGKNLGIAYQIKDDILDGEKALGSLEFYQEKVLEYSLAAKKMIPEITNDKRLQELLGEMVEYLISRQK